MSLSNALDALPLYLTPQDLQALGKLQSQVEQLASQSSILELWAIVQSLPHEVDSFEIVRDTEDGRYYLYMDNAELKEEGFETDDEIEEAEADFHDWARGVCEELNNDPRGRENLVWEAVGKLNAVHWDESRFEEVVSPLLENHGINAGAFFAAQHACDLEAQTPSASPSTKRKPGL